MSPEPASQRPEDSRLAEIYQVAARIFNQKGYHATSINEIADAVHLTKAGLYYYIKGKQDLLYRIMDFAMSQLEDEVVGPARREKDLVVRLRATVSRHASLMTGGFSALAILVNELEGLSVEQRAEIVARQKSYVDFVRETLEGLAARGKLTNIDPTTGAFGLQGMILWIPRWFRPDGRLSADEVVEQITNLALAGLLKKT